MIRQKYETQCSTTTSYETRSYPRKAHISFTSVHLSVSARLPLDGFPWNFMSWTCTNMSRMLQIWLKSDKSLHVDNIFILLTEICSSTVHRNALLLFHCDNWLTNVWQCYVIRTLPVFLQYENTAEADTFSFILFPFPDTTRDQNYGYHNSRKTK